MTTPGLASEWKEDPMMSVLSRRLEQWESDRRLAGSAGFVAKMVGIGLGAGLLLVVCEFLIDAWFRAIR